MQRGGIDLSLVADLHDPAEIHHSHTIGDVPHDGEVMGDEEEGETLLLLQVLQRRKR